MSFVIIVIVIVQLARMAFKADETVVRVDDEHDVCIIHPAAHNIRFYTD